MFTRQAARWWFWVRAARSSGAYYRALLAYEAGDLRAALRLFRTSERGARRLRMDAHRLDVLPQLAEVLALLGRYDDAAAVADEAERLAPRDMDACRKGSLLTNLCWMALRALAESRKASKCERQLAAALELFREACPHPQDRANVLTNLAIHAFAQGRPADAQRYVKLARSTSVSADPRLEVWWMGRITNGRIAPGTCAPGAPSEPYLEISTIRLFR